MQENRELFPIRISVREYRTEKPVGADKSLGRAFEFDLPVLVEFLFITGHAEIENRIEFIAFSIVDVEVHQVFNLLSGIHLMMLQSADQIEKFVRVGFVRQNGRAVKFAECLLDGLFIFREVQHKGIPFQRTGTIQARKGLHGFDIGQNLVHIHGVKQRFVVTGLEFIRDDEKTVRFFFEGLFDGVARKPVDGGFILYFAVVLLVTGKSDDRFVGTVTLFQCAGDGVIVFDGAGDVARHDHGAGFAADLASGDHLIVKMFDDDTGLDADGNAVAFYKTAKSFLSALLVEERIVFNGLHQLVKAVIRGVVGQHIEDESLLNGLFHRVDVERAVFDFVPLQIRSSENLQRFVFRRGGEGEIAGVGEHFPPLDDLVDLVLGGLLFLVFGGGGLREREVHLGGGASALAGMGLVDDDGEFSGAVVVADVVQNEGKLEYRGDDNLLLMLQRLPQVAGVLRPCDGIGELHELFDRIADLFIEIDAVGYDDNGVEKRFAVMLEADQLMRKPGNGVGFPAAGAVLNEIAFPDAVGFDVGEQSADNGPLVIAGKDLIGFFLPGVLVDLFDDLRIVFDDVGKFGAGENDLPEVIGFEAVGIRRISGSVVPPLVEGEEPGFFAFEAGAEEDADIIDGKVNHASFELEEQFPGIAIGLVLLDGVVGVLFGELILQFAGDDGQAVDEDGQIEGEPGVVAGIHELTGDAENILLEPLLRFGIVFGRGLIEEDQISGGIEIDAFAENIDDTAFSDFAAETVQELEAFDLAGEDAEPFDLLRLSLLEKAKEPGCVDGELPVVITTRPLLISVLIAEILHNQRFKTFFLCVCNLIHITKPKGSSRFAPID